MKNIKKTLEISFCLVILSIIALNLNFTVVNNMSNTSLTMANIEALAQSEGDIYRPNVSCHSSISSAGEGNSTHVTWCNTCDAVLAKSWSNSGACNKKNN